MRRRTREMLIFLVLMVVGATTTFLTFRHVPVQLAEATDTGNQQSTPGPTGSPTSPGPDGSGPALSPSPGQSAGPAGSGSGSGSGVGATNPAGGSGPGTTNQTSTTTPGQQPTTSTPTTPPVVWVDVPNVIGRAEGDARWTLTNAGFTTVTADYQPSGNGSCSVIGQDTSVPQGTTTVHITVGFANPCQEV